MKRIYRNDMQQSQKDKLSAINKGKTLSQSTKDKISKSMEKYWSRLPYKPDSTPPSGSSITYLGESGGGK